MRKILLPLVLFLKSHSIQCWAKLKAEASRLLQVSHVSNGRRHLGHRPLLFPRALIGSWMRRGAAGTWTSFHVDADSCLLFPPVVIHRDVVHVRPRLHIVCQFWFLRRCCSVKGLIWHFMHVSLLSCNSPAFGVTLFSSVRVNWHFCVIIMWK